MSFLEEFSVASGLLIRDLNLHLYFLCFATMSIVTRTIQMELNCTELSMCCNVHLFLFNSKHSALMQSHFFFQISAQYPYGEVYWLLWGTFRGYICASSSQRFGRRWIERRWRKGWSGKTDRDVWSSCSTCHLIHSQRRWKERQPFLLLLPLLLPVPAEPRRWKSSNPSCCSWAVSYENFMSIFTMPGSFEYELHLHHPAMENKLIL